MAHPIILFGAFDRHNLGDLLFPHVVAALLPGRQLVFAGLAERDLRAFGGHKVSALSEVGPRLAGAAAVLIHAGGEVLTTDAWQAAVMLQPPERVASLIAYLETHPLERRDWVIHTLGTDAPAPYAMGRSICPQASHVIYNAAGGVDLDQATPEHRAAVLAELKAADALTVRDRRTQALLAAGGVPAGVIPDPAVMTAELFGARIRRLFTTDEPARIAQRFPQGHVAVQLSADFGDDATLGRIAGQLNRIADWTGYGIVLFRAGGAPWHDDAGRLERLAAQINPAKVALYPSLDIWKICALIAQSRACCTSSLHGRIVALSFAVPHINVRLPASPAGASSGPASKQAAFVETWESEETREPAETSTSDAVAGVPACVAIADIAEHLHTVLEMSPQRLQRIAMRLADEYRRGFAALCAPFTGTP